MISDHPPAAASASQITEGRLARRVGLFDAVMVVMGGIIGSGIFINPYVVAQRVHTPFLIVAAWAAGGAIALLGAFIYAELAAQRPHVGGQYAYLREAYHPALGFLYGWVLLLVIQTGGMAAVTVTFARYFLDLTGLAVSQGTVALSALLILTIINCMGVRLGSRVQSLFMLLKIAAIAALILCGFWFIREPQTMGRPFLDRAPSFGLLTAFGSAMVPVLFAYGGWQTANFIAAEVKEPRQNLSRALLIGVSGVILLYLGVNIVCVRALGPVKLAGTQVPATEVMMLALGPWGARLIALGIAISTLGFLSQSVLTAPRVYFAMAEDRLFFRSVGYVSARTRVPTVAIIVQSVWTAVIAFSRSYEKILSYVVAMDFLFFGLTATTIFVFRRRERKDSGEAYGYRMPGHPWTTALFIATCWLVVLNTIYTEPKNSLLGMGILLLGLPVYLLWEWLGKARQS